MSPPTPLRPPSLCDAVETDLRPGADDWPSVFDSPATVDRAWTDFVAGIGDDDQRVALRRALAFARARHEGQLRRGSSTPYWVHPVRVAMELSRWGCGSPEMLQAALLHDTVEDTHTSIGEVQMGFGPEVADLVDWLTAPQRREDIVAYYERLLALAPVRAQVLKIADRVDNLRSIQALVMRTGELHRVWAGSYLRRTAWQVLPLAAAAPSAGRASLVEAMADLAPLVDEAAFIEP